MQFHFKIYKLKYLVQPYKTNVLITSIPKSSVERWCSFLCFQLNRPQRPRSSFRQHCSPVPAGKTNFYISLPCHSYFLARHLPSRPILENPSSKIRCSFPRMSSAVCSARLSCWIVCPPQCVHERMQD